MNKAISINIIPGIVLAIFSFLAVVPVVSAAIADRDAQAAQKAPDTVEAHLKQAKEAYASKKLGTSKDEAKRALNTLKGFARCSSDACARLQWNIINRRT